MRNVRNVLQAIAISLISFSLIAQGDPLEDKLQDKVAQIHRQDVPRIQALRTASRPSSKGEIATTGEKPKDGKADKNGKGTTAAVSGGTAKGHGTSDRRPGSVVMGQANGRISAPVMTPKVLGKEKIASYQVEKKGGHKAPEAPKPTEPKRRR